MTIINGSTLLRAAPLSPMLATKERAAGGPQAPSAPEDTRQPVPGLYGPATRLRRGYERTPA